MNPDSQIKAWAIDRAIETHKIGGASVTPEIILETAGKFAGYCVTPEDTIESLKERLADAEYNKATADAIAMTPASNAGDLQ